MFVGRRMLIYLPVDAEYLASPASATGIAAQKLFGENYARLQKLKNAYDPDGVFFKWNPITP